MKFILETRPTFTLFSTVFMYDLLINNEQEECIFFETFETRAEAISVAKKFKENYKVEELDL